MDSRIFLHFHAFFIPVFNISLPAFFGTLARDWKYTVREQD